MDFTNRSNASTQSQGDEHHLPPANSDVNVKRFNSASSSNSKPPADDKWTRIGIFAGFFAVVILIVAVIVLIANNNNLLSANNNNFNDKSEVSYVKSNKLQAVFLNTGQVYFGNISALNNNYLILTNIFYLQTSSSSSSSSTSSNSNVTLVKLGCELHRPYDQMVINRSQVTFWENLQSDGQVATAVATYEKDNPGPQKCVDQSSSSSTTSGSAAQNANSGSTSTGTSTSGQ
jgi:hypothetical protein